MCKDLRTRFATSQAVRMLIKTNLCCFHGRGCAHSYEGTVWHLPYPRGTSNFVSSDVNLCSDLGALVPWPLHLASLGMRPKKVSSQWPLFRIWGQVKRMVTASI